MKKLIFYDKENDILSIHNGFSSDEKFKGNIDLGSLVLDVSTMGKIRGLEVVNATVFFKEFNIGKKILENIEDAELTVSKKPNSIIIGIVIKSKNVEGISAKIAIPLEVPIQKGILASAK